MEPRTKPLLLKAGYIHGPLGKYRVLCDLSLEITYPAGGELDGYLVALKSLHVYGLGTSEDDAIEDLFDKLLEGSHAKWELVERATTPLPGESMSGW